LRWVRRLVLLVVLALLVLVGEGIYARATVPDDGYVPPPRGPQSFGSRGAPLSFVVLGDSTATGRGAGYEDGIAVGVARHLASRGRAVTLRNFGVSGAQWDDVRGEQLGEALRAAPDLVLIACGANDVTGGRTGGAVAGDVRAVVRELRSVRPGVPIVLTGAPDMGTPPRVPQPLRAVLGWRAERLNAAIDAEVRRLGLVRAPLREATGDAFREDRSLFAPDGFHPDARGYAVWRPVVEAAIDRALPG
jgi:acyl-CoA thioesterase I